MFSGFFFTLKKHKVPVSITEWITLMEALHRGFANSSLVNFYYLARSILVKSETFYDQYDEAFQEYFQGIETPDEVTEKVMEWLEESIPALDLTPEELAQLEKLDLDELRKKFLERLREQKERHDGGNRWIGTGGRSPFGHHGAHPTGIRVGGSSWGGRAVQIAAKRNFRNYRTDITLDVRQIKVALKKLRQLKNIGPEDELDIEETIDKTCKNAGDIELVWKKSRKNTVKVLLLMDTGGSMTPYAHLVNRLFSAAHSLSHFKDFKYYYFHNCIYEDLYEDMSKPGSIKTANMLKNLDHDYKVILVGDAHMAPSELFQVGGAIDYYYYNETPGIEWLKRIADHFRHSVWLNPISKTFWQHPTIAAISNIFPMFEMTVDGLEEAVKALMARY